MGEVEFERVYATKQRDSSSASSSLLRRACGTRIADTSEAGKGENIDLRHEVEFRRLRIFRCVPNREPALANALIRADGMRDPRLRGVRRQDVNRRRRDGQRGVVPAEGDVHADAVVLWSGDRGGSDHLDTACGKAGIHDGGPGCRGGGGALGVGLGG